MRFGVHEDPLGLEDVGAGDAVGRLPLEHLADDELALVGDVLPRRAVEVDLALAVFLEDGLVVLALEAREPREQLAGVAGRVATE